MMKLPNLDWFMGQLKFRGQGNVFSGSTGTDPYYGCMNDRIFRFRIWIDKDENDEYILRACYYHGQNNYDETDSSIISEKTFDATDDGIIKAGEWIESNMD